MTITGRQVNIIVPLSKTIVTLKLKSGLRNLLNVTEIWRKVSWATFHCIKCKVALLPIRHKMSKSRWKEFEWKAQLLKLTKEIQYYVDSLTTRQPKRTQAMNDVYWSFSDYNEYNCNELHFDFSLIWTNNKSAFI